MLCTDVKKPTGDSNPTAGNNTDRAIVPDTASAIKKTAAKALASAVRALKIALLCVTAVAPAACIHMAAAQATTCSVGCEDV